MEKSQFESFDLQESSLVSLQHPSLAASPDRLVVCPIAGLGVLEIKCPYNCKDVSLTAYIKKKKSFYLCAGPDGRPCLKRNHSYYYQIQFQLLVTNRKFCDFIVWRPREFFYERIGRDEELLTAMLPKLKAFYFDHLLPALHAELL